MKILAIDSTSENLVVALGVNNKVYSRVSTEGSKKHNSIIMPYIDSVLEDANIDINDVDYFACVVGPGSFTGIRIGVATIKALVMALNKKAVSITSFEELAFDCKEDEFYTAIDCRHDNFYFAKFKGNYKNIVEVGEMNSCELDKLNCIVIKKNGASIAEKLIAIAIDKISENQFDELTPFYLKKSQAEKEYDQKHMDNIGQ